MSLNVVETALVQYLAEKDPQYFGKLSELRKVMQGWLSYIPQTFPHYTRHTIEHSDQIILQLSKLLFEEEDHERPVVSLSAVEAYILVAAAYLHDAGMVTSDDEKLGLLTSESWNAWTHGDGGGARRWSAIQEFRQGTSPSDDSTRNFLADVQSRFLIAEFVRRKHHVRAADLIKQHPSALARFAFDDAQLQDSIASVCVGHGLHAHELQDSHHYPERRDILGEPVNLRFMAILLRLGDLLDMSCDRACPLLANAASPVPSDSYAHWSQYKRITHRLTAPDTIEISAECETQDEHRVLQDWCQWLVDEVKNAGTEMSRALRHGGWHPPYVSLSKPRKTIDISPSNSATYIPSKWVLEFDRDAILERLIYDVHGEPILFVLELLQNALDATRSKMYGDLVKDGQTPPDYPTQVAEEFRSQYPVHVALREDDVINELSGETETKQTLIIDDPGTGMTREIIERYFLQIGRSYYTSDEYRRTCAFHPISRFGIGFLSVFAASDHVVVETYSPELSGDSASIRISLTGPSSYLLSERGQRRTSGTRIEVRLRDPLEPGKLTAAIRNWCPKVELPIRVDDLGTVAELQAERPDDITYELPDVTEENAQFVIRAFEIQSPPIEGHLFVFAHIGPSGERWDLSNWAKYRYPSEHPHASAPPPISSSSCIHGIERAGRAHSGLIQAVTARIDYRGVALAENLARLTWGFGRFDLPLDTNSEKAIVKRCEEVLSEHLSSAPMAEGKEGWSYKQRLVSLFPVPSFWQHVPGTIRLYIQGEEKLFDLESVLRVDTLRVVVPRINRIDLDARSGLEERDMPAIEAGESPTMAHSDLNLLSDEHREAIFTDRDVAQIIYLDHGGCEIHWTLSDDHSTCYELLGFSRPIAFVSLNDCSVVGVRIHRTTDSTYGHCVLNLDHSLVKWILRMNAIVRDRDDAPTTSRFEGLVSLLETPLSYRGLDVEKLNRYLNQWRAIPDLPPELCPPDLELTEAMFLHPVAATEAES